MRSQRDSAVGVRSTMCVATMAGLIVPRAHAIARAVDAEIAAQPQLQMSRILLRRTVDRSIARIDRSIDAAVRARDVSVVRRRGVWIGCGCVVGAPTCVGLVRDAVDEKQRNHCNARPKTHPTKDPHALELTTTRPRMRGTLFVFVQLKSYGAFRRRAGRHGSIASTRAVRLSIDSSSNGVGTS